MADHTVNVGVVVDVKGEEKLDGLNKKIESANKAVTSSIKDSTQSFAEQQIAIGKRRMAEAAAAAKKAPPVSSLATIKQATAADSPSRLAAIKSLYGQAKGERIGADIGKVISGIGTEVSAFGQFTAGVVGNAIKAGAEIAAVGVAMGAVAVAAGAAAVAIGAFSAAMSLMKNSIKWAGEAADTQIDTFARMRKNRTTFAAETARNMAGTELIGKNFDKLNDTINDSKFAKSDFAKNWGMGAGQLDKFGATQHEGEGAAYGRTRRTDTLDVLEKAVAKREELDKRLSDAQMAFGSESPQARAAMKKQRQFFKDVYDFDEGFGKIASVASTADIRAMRQTTEEIAAMYKSPPNASAALNYKRAIMQYNAIFDMLKFNIGSAAMPGITKAVQGISDALIRIAPALGELGGALVGKGWDVIGDVTQKLAAAAGIDGGNLSQTIQGIADAIKNYPTENISDKIVSFGQSVITLSENIASAVGTIKKAADLLTPEGQKKALMDALETPDEKAARLKRQRDAEVKRDAEAQAGPFGRFQPPVTPGWTPNRAFEKPDAAGPKLEESGQKAGENIQQGAEKGATAVTTGGSTGGKNFADAVMGIPWSSYAATIAGAIAKALSTPVTVNMPGVPGSGKPSVGGDNASPSAASASPPS